MRKNTEKCPICTHPLAYHFGNQCLNWHSDLKRWCRCQDGPEEETPSRKFGNKDVVSVVLMGDNFIWFIDRKGEHWRWMCKEKKLFPVTVVV